MQNDRYDLTYESDACNFRFDSIGLKGIIQKLVIFQRIEENQELYNLAFGDLDEKTKEIDDTVISNNGDSEKVLSTVAATVYFFTNRYPNAYVLLQGSTPARTRLYQIGISKYFDELKKEFYVFGYSNNKWRIFEKNQKYEAFLIRRLI